MKIFTFLLLTILFSSTSFAVSKKKMMELVRHCNILYNPNEAGAGQAFVAALEINLEDGTAIHTRENPSKIHMKDFFVEVTGGGKLTRHSKKGFRIRNSASPINDPYVHLKVVMRERPDIFAVVKVPIHFRVHQNLWRSGASGFSGSDGRNGERGLNGRHEYYRNGYGEDGSRGWEGWHGVNGAPGERGPHLQVYVSKVPFKRDNSELMKIQVTSNNRTLYTRYLDPTHGSIRISAMGGSGGSGGDGGNGGDDGNGGRGSYEVRKDDRCYGQDGYGGDGGDGGHGGNGGWGGPGGDGGQIDVYFASGTKFFQNRMSFNVSGGSGGSAGCGGRGGSYGCAGKGGKGSGRNGYRGNRGYDGQRGPSGNPGNVYFHDWN